MYAPTGVAAFKGFLLEVRPVGSSTPIGKWVVTDMNNQKTIACSGSDTAITHTNVTAKQLISARWIAPIQDSAQQVNV